MGEDGEKTRVDGAADGDDESAGVGACPGEGGRSDEGAVDAAELPLPEIAPSAVRAATSPPTAMTLPVEPAEPAVSSDEAPTAEAADDPEPRANEDDDTVADDALPDGDAPDEASDDPALDEPLDADVQAWRAVPLATRLEALLFAATAPLSVRKLQRLAGDVETADVRDALASLGAHYESSSRAFGLEEIGGGFQLRTRAELSGLLARLGRKRSEEKLSPAALETLAIVAYRQPVLRVDVEKIRGVASGEVLRTLVEKGMVRVAGRADLPGSPLLYGTTPAFLELFGLRDLRDLPTDRELLRGS